MFFKAMSTLQEINLWWQNAEFKIEYPPGGKEEMLIPCVVNGSYSQQQYNRASNNIR